MKRTIVLLLSALLLVTTFAPAAAAPPNPFIGSWESDDDFPGGDLSHVRLQIGGGNGHFHLRDDAATACMSLGFGFVPATISGFGEITDDDPWTFIGTGDLYCYTRDGRGRQLAAEDFTQTLVYDPDTDTLPSDFNCWYRSGSDPAVCD